VGTVERLFQFGESVAARTGADAEDAMEISYLTKSKGTISMLFETSKGLRCVGILGSQLGPMQDASFTLQWRHVSSTLPLPRGLGKGLILMRLKNIAGQDQLD